jgi:hypothetical protein
MNYYYIDYMIRQRQLAEIEACERRRLLFAAGYTGPGFRSAIKKRVVGFVRDLKGRFGGRRKGLPIPPAFINPVAGTPGKGVEL